MNSIRRRESNAAMRRIIFVAPSGTTFSAVHVTSNSEPAWKPSHGVVVEIGSGHYYYEVPRDEIDFVGGVTYRALYADETGPKQAWFAATILPSDEHDTPQPSVWFTT